jgi:hypothetical protein
MKLIRCFNTTVTPLRAFSSLGVITALALMLATAGSFAKPALPKPDASVNVGAPVAPAALPPNLQNKVDVMVELKDAPASVTWAAAYQQAQAQLDAQRNYALQHPALRTSVALLKKTPQQAQLSTSAMTQIKSVAKSISQKQQSLLPSLTGGNIGGRVIYRVQMAYNGIAMVVDPSKISAIQAMPGVKAVHPLHPKYLVNTFSDIDFLNTRPAWTTGPFGTHGENIKVADIDTGLDYIHRNFGGSGAAADYASTSDTSAVPNANYPSPKVPGGIDLVGDAYNGSNVPVPDNNPFDCNGHGTGTASLIAGYGETNAGFTYSGTYDASNPSIASLKIPPGFAPNAKLYPVRVFGCSGGSSTEVVAEGIDWAMTQGTGNPANRVDVINMSLGADESPADDPDAVAASNAASIGIIVCSAAGNAGDSFYIHSSPAAASGTLSVAASFNDQNGFIYNADVTGNSTNLTGKDFLAVYSDASPQTSFTGNVVYARPANASTPLTNAAQVSGNIVLIDRGSVTFAVKAANAQAAGAKAIIMANNVGTDPFVQGGTSAFTNGPNVMISLADGNTIKTAAAFDATTGVPVNPTNVTITPNGGKFVFRSTNPAGTAAGPGSPDTMTSYSSRGPRLFDSATKPDITAPAEVTAVAVSAAERTPINSTSGNAVENFNGTSSATPHVAGVMSLLRQLHPTWSVQELVALACNTATHDLATTVGGGTLYGVGRVGAGRVDVGKAAAANVVAYNSTDPNLQGVSFGAVEVPVEGTTILTKTIKVTNKGATNVTYNTSFVNNPNVSGLGTVLTVNPANFTVNAGNSSTVTVTLTATGNAITHQRDPSVSSTQGGLAREWLTEAGGYAVLAPTDASPTLRVEVYANPKPSSSMHATTNNFVPTSANTGSFTLNLSGSGVVNNGSTASRNVKSLVKAFELQYESPDAGQPNAPTDRNVIKYVGVTTDYIMGSDDEIMFGVERFGSAATPDFASANVEIFIDTNPADIGVTFNPDYGIFLGNIGNDSGINSAGFENVFFSILVDENTNVLTAQDFTNGVNGGSSGANGFIDTNIYNNTGIVIPVFASSMGIPSVSGSTQFQYQVVTFDLNGNVADQSNVLFYDIANPGLEVENSANVSGVTKIGAFTPNEGFWYQDISTNQIPVNWNGANFQNNGSIGVWLFHTHNADGNRSDVVRFLPPTITGFSPNHGAVGDFITITGTNFNAGTTVTFLGGNVNATSVNPISSTTLSVQVPPGATSGPIRVSNAAGSSVKPGFMVP